MAATHDGGSESRSNWLATSELEHLEKQPRESKKEVLYTRQRCANGGRKKMKLLEVLEEKTKKKQAKNRKRLVDGFLAGNTNTNTSRSAPDTAENVALCTERSIR